MSYDWQVTFYQVDDPDAMVGNLKSSVFFRKCTATTVETTLNTVVFSFTPQKPHTLAEIQKKCTQTFKNAGTWHSTGIKSLNAEHASAAVPVEAAPVEAAPATLARRSGVEDIKRMAQGLTNAEVHNLLVFFACRYAQQPQPWTTLSQLMADKRAAASAFTKPADEWDHLLGQCAPLEDVACGRCNVRTIPLSMCYKCQRYCCGRCIPDVPVAKCCGCTGKPQLAVALRPPQRMQGLHWYFHYPMEADLLKRVPKRCFQENRDTQRDPMLLDIAEVRKNYRLDKVGRLAKPPGWESSFTVFAVLAAPDGTHTTVGINLFAFNMNATWRSHHLVKYITNEFMADPRNLEYVGDVIKMTQPVSAVPSSPPSPVIEELPEEVGPARECGEISVETMREEIRQLEAGLPESDEDNEPLRLPKRRRLTTSEAARMFGV